MRGRGRGLRVGLVWATMTGCGDIDTPVQTPAPDYDAFERDVYPILLRDCGFVECHGRTERPFRLYGPGRLRLDADTEPFLDPTSDEVWLSYQRTRSMLTHSGDILEAPLLTKPLPDGGHRGVDDFGRAVYEDTFDPSYVTLVQWAVGELSYGEGSSTR